MGARGLASYGYVVPRATNTTTNYKTTDKRTSAGNMAVTKALKINVVGLKVTMTGALKPTEGMLSMPRVDITFPYSGGFCWC